MDGELLELEIVVSHKIVGKVTNKWGKCQRNSFLFSFPNESTFEASLKVTKKQAQCQRNTRFSSQGRAARQNKRHFLASEMPSLGPKDAFSKPKRRHLNHFSAILKTFSGLLKSFCAVLLSVVSDASLRQYKDINKIWYMQIFKPLILNRLC